MGLPGIPLWVTHRLVREPNWFGGFRHSSPLYLWKWRPWYRAYRRLVNGAFKRWRS